VVRGSTGHIALTEQEGKGYQVKPKKPLEEIRQYLLTVEADGSHHHQRISSRRKS